MLEKVFDQAGEFAAFKAAQAWLKARGFSVGSLMRGAPIGIMLGDVKIAKWRNLDAEDRADLHGIMTTPTYSYREGPVTVRIRRDAPAAVIEAFLQSEADLRNLPAEMTTPGAGSSSPGSGESVDREAQDHVEGRTR